MSSAHAFRGNILYTPTPEAFQVLEGGYIVVQDGIVISVAADLEEHHRAVPVRDFGDQLIIPSFNDLHVHAPQFPMAGLGFDEELLPWLEKYTFAVEARYSDDAFAEALYRRFLHKMWTVGTLRFSAFATLHKQATLTLMRLTQESGLRGFVGKVNMDRNSPPILVETTEQSILDTIEIAEHAAEHTPHVGAIITPRFVPSATAELLAALGEIAERYDLPVQSHLSENLAEILWVRDLHPEAGSYTEVYQQFGLLRPGKTIMAHCVHLTEHEQAILAERDVFIAHCAQSNADLSSGIMPLRRYLNRGLRCVIAIDVAGSHVPDITRHIVATIETSKLQRLNHDDEQPVTLSEAFHLATKASGAFFGDVGSFEEGFAFDALVIDGGPNPLGLGPLERLERYIYAGDDRNIVHRFVAGIEVPEPFAELAAGQNAVLTETPLAQ